jgi:hypothetical protein
VSVKYRISRLDKEASEELAFLFTDLDIEAEIRRLLKILADEADPRRPASPHVDVKHLDREAEHWYRLTIGRYGLRLIFRLLFTEGEIVYQYRHGEAIQPERENYIDIVRAGPRATVYGKGLRERHKKLGKQFG